MPKSIGFLGPTWTDATSYYRLIHPMDVLEAAGYEIFRLDDYTVADDGHLIGRRFSREEVGVCDLIDELDMFVSQRWMNDDAAEVQSRARTCGQLFAADVDDHYWRIPEDNPAIRINTLDEFNAAHYLEQLRGCDAVICSTPELVNFLSVEGCNTLLRRNCVNPDDWIWRYTMQAGHHPRFGWTGTARWRLNDLSMVAPWVGPFVNEHKLEFAQYGTWPGFVSEPEALGIDPERVVATELFRDWAYGYSASLDGLKIDAGFIPLQDHEFNRAKSCLKGMEFAACGIPFVASRLPEYEWFGQGILVNNGPEWVDALERLIEPGERAMLATKARKRLETETVEARTPEMVTQFRELLGDP